MERLSGLDASFLYFETSRVHMHVVATIVLDTSTMPNGYSFDTIRSLVAARLPLVPQFTRKLARVPFDLHHPVWVQDDDVDLDFHIHRVGCPAPGTTAELAAITADIAGRPLDRNRPLWEMSVVEGLAGARVGLIVKMHHCTIDGVSGANLMAQFFDLEQNPAPQPPPDPPKADRAPSDLELVSYALVSRARRPVQTLRTVARTVTAAARFVDIRRSRDVASGMPAPFAAPRSRFNAPVSAHRTVAFIDVPLDDIKKVKTRFQTTVNDVVLAVCGGAIRRYLELRNELPDRSLTAVIPVSVRADETAAVGSNQVSAMFTTLATAIDDPGDRLREIHEANQGAKAEHNAIGADTLRNWAEFPAPATFALAARVYTALRVGDRTPPPYNVIISNVPGPPFPLYLAGGRVEALYPLGPVSDGLGLNVTVLSYIDSVGFGFIADRDAVPDLADLASLVPDALGELMEGTTSI
jgi:WS/DGAT/MGAT family acyltransferase